MYRKQKTKSDISKEFYYLGKKYDIIKTNSKEVIVGADRIFIPADLDINKWLNHIYINH